VLQVNGSTIPTIHSRKADWSNRLRHTAKPFALVDFSSKRGDYLLFALSQASANHKPSFLPFGAI
jgi:hypothetical protein